MNHELIGFIAFSVVTASILPYAWNILRGRSHTSATGWFISTITGAVTFLTYGGVGIDGNLWIAAIELVDPFIVLVAALIYHSAWTRLDASERITLSIALISLIVHVFAYSEGIALIAYTCAIIADMCGAWEIVRFTWKHPEKEQPIAWGISILGTFISFFAITSHTIAQWSLPIYQMIFCLSIFIPTFLYWFRLRGPHSTKIT